MSSFPMWFDGFIEEHYANPPRVIIRLSMLAYIVFSLFCGASNIAAVFALSAPFSALVQGIGILGLTILSLAMVYHYRKQADSPQFKRFVVIIMLFNVVFGVGACIVFHQALKPVAAAPAAEPSTPAPWTPAPTNNTNTSTPVPPALEDAAYVVEP